MAYHDDPKGHTPIIIGRSYIRNNHYSYYNLVHKLIKYNSYTGICVLRYSNGLCFVSETELSNWYILPP